MRPEGSATDLERRRKRAVNLVESGESPTLVARILGVTTSSLHRWRRMARKSNGLTARAITGAKSRLSGSQLRQLEGLLHRGATAYGYPNQLWTSGRVAQLIERYFGVEYHPESVRQLLRKRLNWTSHKPQKRAREGNEKEIVRWKADEFPRIIREAWQRKAHVAFLDESGFLLTPLVRRTLAPRGKRVILTCSARHDRISTIGCVTLSPRVMRVNFYFQLLINQNVHGEEIVEFLQYLTGQVPGEWTIVWDRSRIHYRSKAVREWLAKHAQVVVEDFPAYAPDANPEEWVWSWAKYGKMCNLCPTDVEELYDHVLEALIDIKNDHHLLASFVMDAGVPLYLY
jgi:transposase